MDRDNPVTAEEWVTLREAARQTHKPRQTLMGLALQGQLTVERRGPFWFALADDRYAALVRAAAAPAAAL